MIIPKRNMFKRTMNGEYHNYLQRYIHKNAKTTTKDEHLRNTRHAYKQKQTGKVKIGRVGWS